MRLETERLLLAHLLTRLFGITDPANERSIRLLEALGLREAGRTTGTDGRDALLFAREL